MRALPVAATLFLTVFLGLTAVGSAQMMGPGMGFPGAGGGMPGFGTAPAPPPPQQEPPCFREFAPMKAEAEKRAMALKAAMEKKVPREEACNFVKSFSASEAKLVKYVTTNAQSCGIPPQAVTQMKSNHDRTLKAQSQICSQNVGAAPKPTGPGLSEALGTSRGGTLDPLAPQSGGLDTLTGNVLSR